MKKFILSMFLLLSMVVTQAQTARSNDSKAITQTISQSESKPTVSSITPAIWSATQSLRDVMSAPKAVNDGTQVNNVQNMSNTVNNTPGEQVNNINNLNEGYTSGYIIKLSNGQSYTVTQKYKLGEAVDINSINTH